ncbi:hypothetical protein RIF29_30516 [Crotalaria pallida]|uniref:Uncharacterized protein n=1 Tax=Crotalaria pallida TaxID=3830 RepID=A0AAN9EH10_CROPI
MLRKTLKDFPNMPLPNVDEQSRMNNDLILEQMDFNRIHLAEEFESLYAIMTDEQRGVFNSIMKKMANMIDVNSLPVLYHHPVLSKDSFTVKRDFVQAYGSQIGAYWVCHCPNGDIMRLHYFCIGRVYAFVNGWGKMRNRFNITDGETVDFA